VAETTPLTVRVPRHLGVADERHSSKPTREDLTFPPLVREVSPSAPANQRFVPFSPITRQRLGSAAPPKYILYVWTTAALISWRRSQPRRGKPVHRSSVATRPRPSLALIRRDGVGLFARSALRLQALGVEDVPSAADLPGLTPSTTSPHKAHDPSAAARAEATAERITVLIADADGLFRQGLRLFLALQEDIQVVGEAADSPHALGIAESLHPDVLLLGVLMLKASGLEFLSKLRTKSLKTKVLIFSGTLDDAFIAEALQHGAMGYLLKTSTHSDLVKAVRTTCAGEIWAQRQMLTQVIECMRQKISELQNHPIEQVEHLTEREHEIVQWVMQGMTNKEIAIRLGISEKTVKSHLHSIFGKLKVTRRFQLLRTPVATPSD
jgi:two-component system, NarL family, response regulator LiaR